MKLTLQIIVIFSFMVSGPLLYANGKCIDVNYRKLSSGMSLGEIERTLVWELEKSSPLLETEEIWKQLSFLNPKHVAVFTPPCEKSDRYIVIDLDGKNLLRNVFLVTKMATSREGKGYNVGFLWPKNGEYEKRFKSIKYGDSIEDVMDKIGWRPQAYFRKNQNGETVISFIYMIRDVMTLLSIKQETMCVESIETLSQMDDIQVIIDGKEVKFNKEEAFHFSIYPPYTNNVPQEILIELPDDF